MRLVRQIEPGKPPGRGRHLGKLTAVNFSPPLGPEPPSAGRETPAAASPSRGSSSPLPRPGPAEAAPVGRPNKMRPSRAPARKSAPILPKAWSATGRVSASARGRGKPNGVRRRSATAAPSSMWWRAGGRSRLAKAGSFRAMRARRTPADAAPRGRRTGMMNRIAGIVDRCQLFPATLMPPAPDRRSGAP